MSLAKMTVGIPVHGAISVFKQCHQSLLEALDKNKISAQIVVVNDYSEPDDELKLATYLQGFDNTVLLHTDRPNPNLGLAMNMARRLTRPHDDFFLNLESDVLVSDQTLFRLMLEMDGDESIPASFPIMKTPCGKYDFIFWNRGICEEIPEMYRSPVRCAWGNAGCLLVRGYVARDRRISVDESFTLWCADGDYTSRIREVTGQPVLFTPKACATHIGRQSSKEGEGRYDDLIKPSVELFDKKWAKQLAGGLLIRKQ